VLWNVEEGVQQGAVRAEPRTGADVLQLTLRFSFRARLTAGVRRQRRGGKNYKKTSQAKV
jgi:hypothetical protein